MTPTQRAAIELAIADFEHISAAGGRVEFVERRIAALRAALAETAPVQEQQPAPASKPVLLQCLGCERVGTQEQLSASTDCDCWLHTQPAPVQEQQFTADELDLMRQWFESMQDTNRSFVIDADKKLHQKIIAAIQAAPRAEQPRKAVKLSDEEISTIAISNPPNVHIYARAIEQAVLKANGIEP